MISPCLQSRVRRLPLWDPPAREKPPSPASSTAFYEIQSGTITYDGIDVRDIRKDSLRRSLGVVLQDTHLFTGTVADNIRYGGWMPPMRKWRRPRSWRVRIPLSGTCPTDTTRSSPETAGTSLRANGSCSTLPGGVCQSSGADFG